MRYIFITSIFRSGTSLLSTSLNAHKNMVIGWQPYWLFFKACRNKLFREVLQRPFDPDYPMGIVELKSRKEREVLRNIFNLVKFDKAELLSDISAIKSYLSYEETEMNKDMKPLGLVNYLDGLEPGVAGYILSQLMERLYLAEIDGGRVNKEDVRVLGIKEVFCEEYIEPILDYESLDWVVLHVIRDPRGVFASRNYGKYMEATGSRYPIFFIIRSWRRTVSNYLLNRDREKYLMIKYEDLVGHPKETLDGICSILGVELTEDILDVNGYRDSKGKKWQPNSSFEVPMKISTASIDKWRDVLSAEEIEVIEYFCKSELKYMGYEVTTKSFDVERIFGFCEDTSRVKEWLRKYDFTYNTSEHGQNALSDVGG